MKVTIDGKTYHFKWKHQFFIENHLYSAQTECMIFDNDKNLLMQDSAWCSTKDQYDRHKGMKISLGRVIKAYFDRDLVDNDGDNIRHLIWQEYLNGGSKR